MPNRNVSFSRIITYALAATCVLFGISVLLGSWYTIDARERGVYLRNGAVMKTAEPGLGFKWPFIDAVYRISTQTHTYQWKGVNAYSQDQQAADLVVSVTYRVNPAKVTELYTNYGTPENVVSRVLSPVVMRDLKVVFGRFSAARAITERGALNSIARDTILNALNDEPIIIESVQIEDIQFSKEYERSIEQRMQAEVEVQRLRQNLDREKVQADIVRTKASAEADAVIARAKAEADATKMQGEATASAIKARGEALRENKQLVDLVQAERWDGKLPTHVLPSTSIPMLNMNR